MTSGPHPVGLVDGTFRGTDPRAFYALQRQEIGPPHIPALAELPDVGPHATGLGKVTANLPLPFELRSYGWQLQRGDRISSVDQLRATSHRDSIIQAMADVAQDEAIPEVSVRLIGPVTLMTSAWLPSGQRVIRDEGARTDIAGAWAEGVANLTARISSVLGAHTTVIADEHAAVAAVDGTVRTASGASFERSLDVNEVRAIWQTATSPDATMLLHTTEAMHATAAEASGILVDWPKDRNRATERTWQLIDGLLHAETPVALRIENRANVERYAEELIGQYLDWGLNDANLEHVRLVHAFHQQPETEVGAGLQALRLLAEHAAGYAATL